MRDIKKIIVHCSDTEGGDVKAFRHYHVTHNGWKDIGYHYVIRTDGEIEIGRMLSEAGAHCKGQNHDSIGICLVGKKHFEYCQIDKLKKLVEEIRLWFGDLPVYGHRYFDKNKTCPNFEVRDYL